MSEARIVKRPCYIKDNLCHIPLPKNNAIAICDVEHINLVGQYNWHQTSTGLPKCNIGSGKSISLLSMLFPLIKIAKYIDGDRLNFRKDNVKENVRECRIEEDICYIPMTNGDIATVDSFNIDKIKNNNWCKNKNGYPMGNIKGKHVELHRLLHPEFKICDHINHDKLDNRECNLREVNKFESSQNRRKFKISTSGYKGVSFDKECQKFVAYIGKDGKFIKIGRYSSAEVAARAYDTMAKKLHGEYAVLNFPNE